MKSFSSLKQEILKKWIEGGFDKVVWSRSSSKNKKMKAIKFSADLAMATARRGTTTWSRAIIRKATKNINGCQGKLLSSSFMNKTLRQKRLLNIRRRKIKKKKIDHINNKKVAASSSSSSDSTENILVKKRIKVLKGLIPGGELCLDETCLIKETLDYVVSLQAQVDVMRCLVGVSELLNIANVCSDCDSWLVD